mmetsp:Transcript_26536/g.71688  ORF Transcript_26536/g.71688 Transcript_26536/m.71688 type:complete len:254 (-) Transcript_26536:62-823(-)
MVSLEIVPACLLIAKAQELGEACQGKGGFEGGARGRERATPHVWHDAIEETRAQVGHERPETEEGAKVLRFDGSVCIQGLRDERVPERTRVEFLEEAEHQLGPLARGWHNRIEQDSVRAKLRRARHSEASGVQALKLRLACIKFSHIICLNGHPCVRFVRVRRKVIEDVLHSEVLPDGLELLSRVGVILISRPPVLDHRQRFCEHARRAHLLRIRKPAQAKVGLLQSCRSALDRRVVRIQPVPVVVEPSSFPA